MMVPLLMTALVVFSVLVFATCVVPFFVVVGCVIGISPTVVLLIIILSIRKIMAGIITWRSSISIAVRRICWGLNILATAGCQSAE
jgi:hypothetical protein